MVSLANQESLAKTGRSKAIKEGNHNPFTLCHPTCFLHAIFPQIVWTIRSTNESCPFSLETEIRVWKNAVRTLIDNVSKKQVVKNDLRKIVLFKIIIILFICVFYSLYFILFFDFFRYARASVRTGSYAPD